MENINGKVWIENTDSNITDVLQLDFNTHKLIKLFISNGANIEIGEGYGGHGVGLYCTNLTKEELKEIIKKDYESRNTNIPVVVSSLYSYIKALSESHYEAEFHGYTYNINSGDVLYNIRSTCKKDVIPKILKLEEVDRAMLISMLESLKIQSGVSTDLITRIIYFASHPELEEKKDETKKGEKTRELVV